MADALALGASGGNPMEVQVLSSAPSGFVPQSGTTPRCLGEAESGAGQSIHNKPQCTELLTF